MTSERADLLQALGSRRRFLRYTVRDLDDESARRRTTVSALSLGGLVKHVTLVEQRWARFMVEGGIALSGAGKGAMEAHAAGFVMGEDETLVGLLATYEEVAAATDALVGGLASFDEEHALPEAPWFPPGATWSNRQVLLHVIAETAQHAGHADIIRESLDGAKTMG